MSDEYGFDDELDDEDNEAASAIAPAAESDRITTREGRVVAVLSANWAVDELERRLVASLEPKILEHMKKTVTRIVSEKIAKFTDDLTKELVRRELEAVLKEGWFQTDSYGHRQNKIGGLRDLIASRVVQYTAMDSYNRRSKIGEIVDEAIKADMKEEVAKLRETLRTALTGKITDELRSTVENLLAGLKR